MTISSRTPEGVPNRCPVCGGDVRVEPSNPFGDAPCPHCGHLLWFVNQRQAPGTPPPASLTGRRSLAQRLEECQRERLPGIPVEELLDYMTSAARAIDYLSQPVHALGSGPPTAIQYCDIKPGNLLIVDNGLQVCDYGLARPVTADARKTPVAGTPAYMAPELLVGKPSVGTDQYSLAITYYELRTGKLPFEEQLALQAHITGQLDLSLVRPAEQVVLRRATQARPDQRYPSCLMFVRGLERAVAEG